MNHLLIDSLPWMTCEIVGLGHILSMVTEEGKGAFRREGDRIADSSGSTEIP